MNKELIKYFTGKIRASIPGVKEIVLFGSRARGDNNEGSDYDFLIVLKEKDGGKVHAIRDLEVDLLNKYDALAGSIICSEDEWEKKKNYPIGRNILKEGVSL